MKIAVSAPGYLFRKGLLVLVNRAADDRVQEKEPDGIPVVIQNDVGESPVLREGIVLIFIGECDIVRVSDRTEFHVPRMSAREVNVTTGDISRGELRLRISAKPLRIKIADEQENPLPSTLIVLVSVKQSHEFTTNGHGEVVVFEEAGAYRVVVPGHERATVTLEDL